MSQSLANVLVHIIFSTKHREPLILPEIMKDLHDYLAGIARHLSTNVHEIGGVEDHVHLLISLPRTLTLSKLVEELKKKFFQMDKDTWCFLYPIYLAKWLWWIFDWSIKL